MNMEQSGIQLSEKGYKLRILYISIVMKFDYGRMKTYGICEYKEVN